MTTLYSSLWCSPADLSVCGGRQTVGRGLGVGPLLWLTQIKKTAQMSHSSSARCSLRVDVLHVTHAGHRVHISCPRRLFSLAFQMRRRCSGGPYKQSSPRSSEHKVHPESPPGSFCSSLNAIQIGGQRAHRGFSMLSWLQIRLCVITLFSSGKST